MINIIKLIKQWFIEYFSKCRPINKKYIDNEQLFLICGHRGSPTKEIENTFPSFETALKDGANSLEIDLCLTKDKKVVIWHDWNPNDTISFLRGSGFEPDVMYKPDFPSLDSEFRKNISELTFEELISNFGYRQKNGEHLKVEAKIPLFEEFLIWVKDKDQIKRVFLDIKVPVAELHLAPEIVRQADELTKRYNPKCKFIFETFNSKILHEMKKFFPEKTYCLDVEPRAGFILNPRAYSSVKAAIKNKNHVTMAFRPRQITIAYFTTFRRIVRYDVKRKYSYNKKNKDHKIEFVVGATVNDPEELECVVKLGINGIQTDFPDRLRKIAEKYGRNV